MSYPYEPRADRNAELREELVKLARQKPATVRIRSLVALVLATPVASRTQGVTIRE